MTNAINKWLKSNSWLSNKVVMAIPTCTLWTENTDKERYEFVLNRSIYVDFSVRGELITMGYINV